MLGPENFCYAPHGTWQVVVDVGVGRRPTFGDWIRERTAAFVVVCDPTPRHLPGLRAWVRDNPRTDLIEAAVGTVDGVLDFYESNTEESGSAVASHVNRSTPGRQVSVPSISLRTLLDLARRHGGIDLVKLDLEGSEFLVLLDQSKLRDLVRQVPQWLVEFHPAPQTGETFSSIAKIRRLFRELGYSAFSRNGTDYLFWRA